jgi:hypothetical protein
MGLAAELLGIDTDPAYWLGMARRAAFYAAVALLFGGPVGFVVWKKTDSRRGAVVAGVAAGVIGLLVVGLVYYMVVLCPPEAGCW